MKRLSIIVPVYNVEKYLSKCLDSLLKQDIQSDDYEIILINDGSTDDSGAIAETYAAKYSFVRLITQANGGLSAARNLGINQAVGKYIQFVDSDDFLEPNVLDTLVAKMENGQLDVLRFNYQNVNEQYQVINPYRNPKQHVNYNETVTDGTEFLANKLGYACYAVQFMIRATLLQKSENQFKIGVYFEDTEWTPRLLVNAHRVTSIDTVIYNYLIRKGSITQSVGLEKKRKVLNDLLTSIDTVIFLRDNYPQLLNWSQRFIARIHINYLKYLAHNLFNERRVFIKKLLNFKCLPIQSDHENQHYVFLINLSPYIFVSLLKLKSIIK